MIRCNKNTMLGFKVRARRISGKRWLVYKLSDPERPDYVGNRKAIDIVYNRKSAYFMIRDLDEPTEEEDVDYGES